MRDLPDLPAMHCRMQSAAIGTQADASGLKTEQTTYRTGGLRKTAAPVLFLSGTGRSQMMLIERRYRW